jgi:hypothetical protein
MHQQPDDAGIYGRFRVQVAASPRQLGALSVCLMVVLSLCAARLANAALPIPTTSVACPGTTGTPFAPWGDTDSYMLAPTGDFEATSFASAGGWTLTGGAAQVAGSETFGVHAKTDSHSLSIPAGATATTPAICVNVNDPTIRLFATRGNTGSTLNVDVIATLVNGVSVTIPLAKLQAGSAWAPTPAIYFHANVFALKSLNGQTSVRFRFTSAGNAGFKIDDLYLDPRKGA